MATLTERQITNTYRVRAVQLGKGYQQESYQESLQRLKATLPKKEWLALAGVLGLKDAK